MQELAKVCEEAARLGGQILLDWRGRFGVKEKGRFDLVTEADIASQLAIRRFVLDSFPDHGFLGEEDTVQPGDPNPLKKHEYCWIVDPLDGTTNYIHGMKDYCTSIALHCGGRIVVAAIFSPELGECFTAVENNGAFVNGTRLEVSSAEQLEESLVAGSFPPASTRESFDVQAFTEVLEQCRSIRRLGSAALNLCYVAAGRMDAYWAFNLKPWDMAAGYLLVEEAGGIVTTLDDGRIDIEQPRFIASATRPLHDELLKVFGEISK